MDSLTLDIPASGAERTLADHLAALGHPLNTRCNGRGLCSGCRVVLEDDRGASSSGRPSDHTAQPADVLACQFTTQGPARVQIPPRSLLSHPPVVVSDFRTAIPTGRNPIFPDGASRPLGIAVDIGTTTVAILLADLATGKILARASALNGQVSHGDNVLSRIFLCQQDKSWIERLHRAFWNDTFHPLLKDVLDQSGATREQVAGLVIAGNTTMLHLAAAIDPTSMGTVPFAPIFLDSRRLDPGISGFETILLPGLSAYVGSDISAGAICCASTYSDAPTLLIDVGTNGEILLSGPAGLLACATAAGPAFEGCGLTCGMRAAPGTIQRIRLNSSPLSVDIEVIGDRPTPIGITGSAYVDFLAEGRAIGLLAENGRFNKSFVASNTTWFSPDGSRFLPDPAHPQIAISEVDVALLLQAKAAIAAGVLTLLKLQSLSPSNVERVFLAGGFGLHLSIPHAIDCGLLPGFLPEQITAVGNTSLGGAYLAMLDQSLVSEMDALRANVRSIELNQDPDFEDTYLDQLALS